MYLPRLSYTPVPREEWEGGKRKNREEGERRERERDELRYIEIERGEKRRERGECLYLGIGSLVFLRPHLSPPP